MAISNNNIPQQTYLNRDFEGIRNDLMAILKVYYPDQWASFNSASIGSSLVDLLAFVSDNLSFNADKIFNELFINSATNLTSLYRLAQNMGYKPRGMAAAITVCDISVTVPVSTTQNSPDTSYMPLFRSCDIAGAGQTFEITDEVDFSSDFSTQGVANRTITPNFSSSQNILNYTITKREIVTAGVTKIYSQTISLVDSQTPFLKVTLPDTNVLDIISVIAVPGTGFATNPSYADFNNNNYKYYEVNNLSQDKIFTTDPNTLPTNGVYVGQYLMVAQRFEATQNADGTATLIFGGGDSTNNAYQQYLNALPINQTGLINIKDILNNQSLGVKLPNNSTLFVQFRVGGGLFSNVGSNIFQAVSNIDAVIMGSDPNLNQNVINSTKATNIISALGGADMPTADELRYNIQGAMSIQGRCVNLSDYIKTATMMGGKFGAPFRIHGDQQDNKIILYMLFQNANGQIMLNSLSTVKTNMINYLEPYRMLNDFVEIQDGKVVNLQVEVDLYTDKSFNGSDIKLNALNAIADFFNINKANFNQNIYLAQLSDVLKNIPGVINVVDIRFYNVTGGNYSNTLIGQASGIRELIQSPSTFRTAVATIGNSIYGTALSLFEIRYPQQDIFVRIS